MSAATQLHQPRVLLASNAAPALHFADWSSPLATYLSCRGDRYWDENPDKPERGIRLLPALRAWASKELGVRFEVVRQQVAGKENQLAHVRAQPDGLTEGGRRALLMFTPRHPEKWLESEESEDNEEMNANLVQRKVLPKDVRIEAALTRLVLGCEQVTIGALIAGRLTLLDEVPSSTFDKLLLAALWTFWKRNVVDGRPPNAVSVDEALVRKLFPKPTQAAPRKFGQLDADQQQNVLAWAKAQQARTKAQKLEKDLRPMVVQAIGEASGICEFPPDSGVTSVSFDTRDPHPNNGTWKAIAELHLGKLKPKSAADLVRKHTPEVGTRVLRPFFSAAAKTVPPGTSPKVPLEAFNRDLAHLRFSPEPAVFRVNYDGDDPIPVNDKAKEMVEKEGNGVTYGEKAPFTP